MWPEGKEFRKYHHEAALIFELARDPLAADPRADVGQLLDEA